jgi:hypothetical protein
MQTMLLKRVGKALTLGEEEVMVGMIIVDFHAQESGWP